MKRLNKQDFIQAVQDKYPNDKFKIIEYNGTSKPGRYYCELCQKEYKISRMGKLLASERKHVCSHCWLSHYTQEVLDMFPNNNFDFIKIGYKENLHKPTIIYKCKNCQQIIEKPFIEFLKYPTCIYCDFNAKRRNTIGFLKILPKEFELLEEYQGKDKKVLFRHNCGFIFRTAPNNIINGGTGCPKCSKTVSRGEKRIIRFLELYNIEYEKEKKFNWSGLKRYDFFLPKYNLIIEFNGKQHYIENDFFELSLSQQQERDKEKYQMAQEHGINYLIIPYTSINEIEEILTQRLSLVGVEQVPLETESISLEMKI